MAIAPGAAFVAALVGGLAGSGHCAAMCGPFAGFQGLQRFGQRFGVGQLAYHGGRLTTYMALGTIAGLASESLAQVADLLHVQRALAVFMGLMLMAVGCSYLLPPRYLKTKVTVTTWAPLQRLAAGWRRLLSTVMSAARSGGPVSGPFLLGLTSTLLPCGFLYTFALAAAATGSQASALATMAGFALGTAPALVGAAVAARVLRVGVLRHARKVVGVALIILGVVGVVGRWGASADPVTGQPAPCHEQR